MSRKKKNAFDCSVDAFFDNDATRSAFEVMHTNAPVKGSCPFTKHWCDNMHEKTWDECKQCFKEEMQKRADIPTGWIFVKKMYEELSKADKVEDIERIRQYAFVALQEAGVEVNDD